MEIIAMNLCMKCFKRKPVEEFDVEEVIDQTTKFVLFMKEPYKTYVRSFTCKECGTTKRADWIREWRQNG